MTNKTYCLFLSFVRLLLRCLKTNSSSFYTEATSLSSVVTLHFNSFSLTSTRICISINFHFDRRKNKTNSNTFAHAQNQIFVVVVDELLFINHMSHTIHLGHTRLDSLTALYVHDCTYSTVSPSMSSITYWSSVHVLLFHSNHTIWLSRSLPYSIVHTHSCSLCLDAVVVFVFGNDDLRLRFYVISKSIWKQNYKEILLLYFTYKWSKWKTHGHKQRGEEGRGNERRELVNVCSGLTTDIRLTHTHCPLVWFSFHSFYLFIFS